MSSDHEVFWREATEQVRGNGLLRGSLFYLSSPMSLQQVSTEEISRAWPHLTLGSEILRPYPIFLTITSVILRWRNFKRTEE